MAVNIKIEISKSYTIIENTLSQVKKQEANIKKHNPGKKFIVVRKVVSTVIPYSSK